LEIGWLNIYAHLFVFAAEGRRNHHKGGVGLVAHEAPRPTPCLWCGLSGGDGEERVAGGVLAAHKVCVSSRMTYASAKKGDQSATLTTAKANPLLVVRPLWRGRGGRWGGKGFQGTRGPTLAPARRKSGANRHAV
jgi:hypothetical protein